MFTYHPVIAIQLKLAENFNLSPCSTDCKYTVFLVCLTVPIIAACACSQVHRLNVTIVGIRIVVVLIVVHVLTVWVVVVILLIIVLVVLLIIV